MNNVRSSQPCISMNFCTEFSNSQALPCVFVKGTMLISMNRVITKRIIELLIGNSRFLIHNLLNQLFYYADIKESSLFLTKNFRNFRDDCIATVFSRLDGF